MSTQKYAAVDAKMYMVGALLEELFRFVISLVAFEIGKTSPNCVEAIDSKHTIALVITLSLALQTLR